MGEAARGTRPRRAAPTLTWHSQVGERRFGFCIVTRRIGRPYAVDVDTSSEEAAEALAHAHLTTAMFAIHVMVIFFKGHKNMVVVQSLYVMVITPPCNFADLHVRQFHLIAGRHYLASPDFRAMPRGHYHQLRGPGRERALLLRRHLIPMAPRLDEGDMLASPAKCEFGFAVVCVSHSNTHAL